MKKSTSQFIICLQKFRKAGFSFFLAGNQPLLVTATALYPIHRFHQSLIFLASLLFYEIPTFCYFSPTFWLMMKRWEPAVYQQNGHQLGLGNHVECLIGIVISLVSFKSPCFLQLFALLLGTASPTYSLIFAGMDALPNAKLDRTSEGRNG